MLDWSREELAQASGLSYNTIRKLESGCLSPRENTALGLFRAFDGAGIHFTEDDGIRRERTDVQIIKGQDSADAFFDTLFHTAKRKRGEVVGVFKSQEIMIRALGILRHADMKRMDDLALFADMRFVFTDISGSFMPCQIRTVPKYCGGPVSFIVYGSRYAIIRDDGPRGVFQYFIFNDVDTALKYKEYFNMVWDMAAPVVRPSNTAPKTARTKTAI